MKKKILMLLLPVFLFSQNTELKITVVKSKDIEGFIYLALYDSPNNFLKTPVYKLRKRSILKQDSIDIYVDTSSLKKEKEYAISLFIDTSNNGKLDKNFFGSPLEPYGVSNNKKRFFGPPEFGEAKFWLKKGQITNVTILTNN